MWPAPVFVFVSVVWDSLHSVSLIGLLCGFPCIRCVEVVLIFVEAGFDTLAKLAAGAPPFLVNPLFGIALLRL